MKTPSEINRIRRLCLLFLLLTAASCSASDETPALSDGDFDQTDRSDSETLDSDKDSASDSDSDSDAEAVPLPLACDEIYDPDRVPTFEIEIASNDWKTLQKRYKCTHAEHENGGTPKSRLLDKDEENHEDECEDEEEMEEADLEEAESYLPLISFRYGEEVIENAAIRLRGSPDHWWPDPKMQFNISFKEFDPDGRFHGLRKINLDNAHSDTSFLHDRAGMEFMRDLGLPVPCVNHVRLVVNGEYFGLYVNIEHVDQEFLARQFGEEDKGNLYKYQSDFIWDKKTNEGDPDRSDLLAFSSPANLDALRALIDEDEALTEWVGESMIPHCDGFFSGAVNIYIYNHPTRGFVFIPWDIDYSFDLCGWDIDPLSFRAPWGGGKPMQIALFLADPIWRERYIQRVQQVFELYTPEYFNHLIESWETRIRPSLLDDPNRSFTMEEHEAGLQLFRQHFLDRIEFIQDWFRCIRDEIDVQTVELGGRSYDLIETPCSWPRSLSQCERLGGTLATPRDDAEQTALSEALFTYAERSWWIGGNRENDPDAWVDAEDRPLDYFRWGPNQPYMNDDVRCVKMSYTYEGAWSTEYCSVPAPAICQKAQSAD